MSGAQKAHIETRKGNASGAHTLGTVIRTDLRMPLAVLEAVLQVEVGVCTKLRRIERKVCCIWRRRPEGYLRKLLRCEVGARRDV
mgnify:CR=1 FL=1